MYVVNTRLAENGRRLVKIGEFVGRAVAHGVVPENPPANSPEDMLREKNAFVTARGGTVRNPLQSEQQAAAASAAADETDSGDEQS
jgi:hypothetical protein